MIVIVILLLVVLILFGLASISESYAAAQQAKATIAAAQAAQIASVTNLIVVVVGAVLLLALLAGAAYLLWLKNQPQPRARITPRRETPPPQIPAAADPLTQLTQLMIVKTLQDMQREPHGATTYLPGPRLNVLDEDEEKR
jgi:flagellar basal body-associated protein FliL